MILVTGGTGFVGKEVVNELLGLGYRVRLLVRDPKRATHFAHNPRVELVQGDAHRPETLPAAMAGAHGIVNLIGIIAETSSVTFEQAHVEAARNLLTAATAAGVTRWVQMSSIGTRPCARSRYHLTKWQAEELVRQSGIDWTIFRASLIYGYDERDRLINALGTVARLLLAVPLFDGGRALIQPVSVRDVAHCLALALAKEASIGKTYDLVGPVASSWRDMAGKIVATLGLKSIYEEIPLLLKLRSLLWLVTALLPIVVLVGLIWGGLNIFIAALAGAVWIVLVAMAVQWRPVILFNVPADLLGVVSEALDSGAPRALRFSDQVKMVQEDNVGDPRPAMETFGYVPESFQQGVERVLLKKK